VGFLQKHTLALTVVAVCLAAPWSGASAHTFKTIYTFCQKANCTDGKAPNAGVIADASGKLFGTTASGGPGAHGTVFELVPNVKKTKWAERTIYTFCPHDDCSEGASPNGGLIEDTAGNLYGVTYQGGPANEGVVYELSPPAAGKKKWTFAVLHRFCVKAGCIDGLGPSHKLGYAGAASGAPYDGVSPLYGVAAGAGNTAGGVAFQLTPQPGKWDYKIIHAFCGNVCTDDGAGPDSDLIADDAGDIYGTTDSGGVAGFGTAFKLIPNAQKTKWAETILYAFCSGASGCAADGYQPTGGLVLDQDGNFWGTTVYGGNVSNACALESCGTVFKLAPGSGGVTETAAYRFCAEANCADGAQTAAGSGTTTTFGTPATDGAGNLFGATQFGGANRSGTVFELNANGYSVLYSFCQMSECTDGSDPSTVILDGAGDLFGTTSGGGNSTFGNGGTVFELTP
jgi:uncharacterized repeat protein (TIGR03803 family)